jgi:hypothetical protein
LGEILVSVLTIDRGKKIPTATEKSHFENEVKNVERIEFLLLERKRSLIWHRRDARCYLHFRRGRSIMDMESRAIMSYRQEGEMSDQPNTAYGVAGAKRYYSIGDTIARMGDPADGFYVLLTGKIGVFKKDFTVAEVNLRGTIFGELGCILDIPRTATLQALEPTSVLFVRMTIDELVEKHPEFAKRLLVDLANRLARTTESWWAVAADPVFK